MLMKIKLEYNTDQITPLVMILLQLPVDYSIDKGLYLLKE